MCIPGYGTDQNDGQVDRLWHSRLVKYLTKVYEPN
jgi:hypothetical protein